MKYLEIGNTSSGQSFLFVKRISPHKGTFPTHHEVFPERFKRRIGSTPTTTLHEASVVAVQRSTDIEHLQVVSVRDRAGRTNTTKDLVAAAKTWLWFNEVEDLPGIRAESLRRTKEGEAAANTLAMLTDSVKAFYSVDGDGYTHKTIYTPFGDHLLGVLSSGQAGNLFSEAVALWASQGGRGHMKATEKPIHDATRFVGIFNDFVGDRPMDQITRSNVAAYITHRCKAVKTTSVDREIHTLRAVWSKAADALDVITRNPFARQPILGLGTDAIRRHTPSSEEHQSLMQVLQEHPRRELSYVIPMLAVIALTGLRLSEVWGIQPSDLDADKDQLLIRPNALRTLKTAHSERPFPVLPELASWLEIYMRMKRPSSANAASATTGCFLKTNGFKLTAHCLRHGFKQRLVEVDTPANVIEELMGWSSQSMMRHYGVNAVTGKKRHAIQLAYDQIAGTDRDPSPDQGSVIPTHETPPSSPLEMPLKRIKTTRSEVNFATEWLRGQSIEMGDGNTLLKASQTGTDKANLY
jgi:integrase